MMTNKFSMTVEENIFYAKRNVIDSIWKEANIEGIGVTFPQTQEIYEGRVVAGLSVNETIAINNLKHAWQFVIDTIDVPVDLAYIRQINMLVGQGGIVFDCGNFRNSIVGIGGTDWKPDLPDYNEAKEMIADIVSESPGQQRALHMFAALCRAQLFNDGNKRTAQLVANKMLISDGAGIFAIPVSAKERFGELLVQFYETNEPDALLDFLAEKAIDGMDRAAGQTQTDASVSLDSKVHSCRASSKALEDSGNKEPPKARDDR